MASEDLALVSCSDSLARAGRGTRLAGLRSQAPHRQREVSIALLISAVVANSHRLARHQVLVPGSLNGGEVAPDIPWRGRLAGDCTVPFRVAPELHGAHCVGFGTEWLWWLTGGGARDIVWSWVSWHRASG